MKKRLRQYAVHVGRVTLHVSRWTLFVSAAVLALLAIVLTIAHFLLPMIAEQKQNLEQYLSNRSGHQVRIESLHAYWDGLHPGAQAKGLQVYASDGVRPAIRLSEVRISLALLPLLWGELEINSLLVVNPSLALERLTDGRFRISGFNPLQTEQPTDDEKFVGWLFRQNRLEIENGELQWFDHREAGAALRLARVNLTLRNRGDRHQLGFSAVFPPDMCRNCSLILDINGNPFTSSAWDGDIYLRAEEVNIKALPLIAREKLPETFRGKFNAQMWSEWEQGRPVSIKGNAHVVDLRLPVPGWTTPLGIHVAGGDLSWQAKRAGWRLDVANPVIGLTGPEWAAEHLRIVFQPEESQIQVKHLDLEDITGFVTRLKNELSESGITVSEKLSMWLDYWIAARPEGAMNDFNLRLIGNAGSPEDFSLETDVRAVAALAYQKYPGVQGLSGHLSLARHAGHFQLDAGDITVSLPRVFRAPLAAQRLSGDLSWEKSAEHWLIEGSNLRLVSEDGRGTGTLSVNVPLDTSISPHVKLRVDFSNGNGAHAARYYPVYHLSASTLAWMERSFAGGNITQGYLVYDGPIRHFPFRDNTGKFELRGHVRHGIYQYLPGWEPIRQAEVDVAINGSEVLVTGQGKIAGLNTDQVVVESHESSAGQHVVHVSGKVSGPLNETLTVLREIKSESDTTNWLPHALSGMRGSGEGILSLNLSIPVHQARSVAIDGEYRFLKNTLLFSVPGLAAEAIDGSVRFTEAGIREGGLRLQFLGGSTVLAAGRQQDQLLIHGQGTITAPGLAPLVGPQIAPRIAGSINWNGMWRWKKGVSDLRAEADIGSLKVSLPPPLDRPDGLAGEKLVVRTESSTANGIILDISAGNRMSGKLDIGRNANGWSLTRGRIGFGEARAALPEANGLHVSARMDSLDINQWLPWLGGGAAAVPEVLNHVSAEIRSLNMFDRNFGGINFDFFRSREVWSGTVDGAKMAGNLKFSGKGPAARFELDLAHLILPDKLHRDREVESDPRRLPAVELRSKSFQVWDKSVGELDFMAIPGESGWSIKRFNLTRPEMKLNASGRWRLVNNNHESELNIEFSSSNMGKTMEALGAPGQVAGGEVFIKSHLSWPGSPTNPQLATLNGDVELSAKKGRFLQVKAGAGRLFGLLDLSAIGRYITLDFSPVFGKGLIYDRIQGQVKIEQGNAYSRNFSIRGPAMQIEAGGRIGLATEDYDLAIELQPKISNTVTLATWGVLGPQVAAAVLAVQKIFKKQIAAGTRINYVVKGPWDNPVITKQEKGAAKTTDAVLKADDEAQVR